MTKTILKIVGGIVLVLVIVGGYIYPKVTQTAGAPSPAGTTNTNKPFYTVVLAVPSTSAASSTSALNNGASDRNVDSSALACNGVQQASSSVAALLFQVATTSVAGQGLQGNTNYAANITVPTSTTAMPTPPGVEYISTSTEGVLYGLSRIWPAGGYLTGVWNATDTASCTWAINYTPL